MHQLALNADCAPCVCVVPSLVGLLSSMEESQRFKHAMRVDVIVLRSVATLSKLRIH